jgi:hypothetical protein
MVSVVIMVAVGIMAVAILAMIIMAMVIVGMAVGWGLGMLVAVMDVLFVVMGMMMVMVMARFSFRHYDLSVGGSNPCFEDFLDLKSPPGNFQGA